MKYSGCCRSHLACTDWLEATSRTGVCSIEGQGPSQTETEELIRNAAYDAGGRLDNEANWSQYVLKGKEAGVLRLGTRVKGLDICIGIDGCHWWSAPPSNI